MDPLTAEATDRHEDDYILTYNWMRQTDLMYGTPTIGLIVPHATSAFNVELT